ncbi:hypothetical protein AMAG_04572 [Allomyces macrogynus ATCC 38327]|uniref:DNA-directed RNA polymerase I, II, and III subunit RPABC4 n=1 Tax=Allomyces macrogynus (strain ATCC 38327) TaxID=578462 RepID=A0A0L0S5I3_ALLM3|nr:DNA-directed RNA polymerase core subunit rpc10 [Allomyces javanicus]KAJ3369859.1 DNA-directed RNA polymerase core subunit rpc10 [Allomyces arbusculus]KNE57715.1 hypothetical protein AMAG_04572 [Allomyces macrogynus ATCC 38327]|eukprot:KNE57715.1 hypothetical protein AMAG_04572 [Allomyces macrogynus ATCC 38327]
MFNAGAYAQPPPATAYLCAACGEETELKPKEPVRCKTCGHRVLYKKRTSRMVQFEAR